MANHPKTEIKSIRGKFEINHTLCGPAMTCPGATRTGSDRRYMDPKFDHNYLVTEQLKGDGLSEEDYHDLRALASALLRRNPERSINIRVESIRIGYK